MKDVRSLLLVLLSFGLAATWIYHLYDKADYAKNKTEINNPVKDSSDLAKTVRDSLQKNYSAMINRLDLRLDSSRSTSDSLQSQLVLRINEINRLKKEISKVLQNPNSTNSELSMAKQKMKELEDLVQSLRDQKNELQSEKERLSATLDRMGEEVNSLQQNIKKLDDENKSLTEKIKMASTFVASALHFTAIDVKGETKEQETSQAKRADKFVASFVLQNNFNEYMGAEIMIIITKPDGSTLQSSVWDSGTFDTKAEGRRNYTRKMRFDYAKGEQKTLIFTLDVENCQKGNYTLEIWHNGVRVGQTTKHLS
jgi:myosin heavy subunit